MTTASAEMRSWQYRTLLAELGQVELHASDDTCPCNQVDLDPPEYCLGKHLLNVATLARETALMDGAHREELEDLADEALEHHEEARHIYCHGGEWPDLAKWGREKRKALEPVYYACAGGEAAGLAELWRVDGKRPRPAFARHYSARAAPEIKGDEMKLAATSLTKAVGAAKSAVTDAFDMVKRLPITPTDDPCLLKALTDAWENLEAADDAMKEAWWMCLGQKSLPKEPTPVTAADVEAALGAPFSGIVEAVGTGAGIGAGLVIGQKVLAKHPNPGRSKLPIKGKCECRVVRAFGKPVLDCWQNGKRVIQRSYSDIRKAREAAFDFTAANPGDYGPRPTVVTGPCQFGNPNLLPICTPEQMRKRERCIMKIKARPRSERPRSPHAVCTVSIGCRPGRKGERGK